ncbi:hypothetical protein ACFW1A_37765 [Kitasatospora sp. NPDC058965]|uniref:hypothetical protein n=1 Tax=Kitasatospora sp. NPDC058965 TaxID=3346682 RepID=UPI0036A6F06B
MAENTEPTTDQAEVEVEAHAEEILPLQELASPEPDSNDGGGYGGVISTSSVVC